MWKIEIKMEFHSVECYPVHVERVAQVDTLNTEIRKSVAQQQIMTSVCDTSDSAAAHSIWNSADIRQRRRPRVSDARQKETDIA